MEKVRFIEGSVRGNVKSTVAQDGMQKGLVKPSASAVSKPPPPPPPVVNSKK